MRRQVAEALQDRGMRERAPVGVLKRQLMSLQADVAAAHERLHTTEVMPCPCADCLHHMTGAQCMRDGPDTRANTLPTRVHDDGK